MYNKYKSLLYVFTSFWPMWTTDNRTTKGARHCGIYWQYHKNLETSSLPKVMRYFISLIIIQKMKSPAMTIKPFRIFFCTILFHTAIHHIMPKEIRINPESRLKAVLKKLFIRLSKICKMPAAKYSSGIIIASMIKFFLALDTFSNLKRSLIVYII